MTWKKFNGETIQIPILEEVEHAIEREYNLGNKLKVHSPGTFFTKNEH